LLSLSTADCERVTRITLFLSHSLVTLFYVIFLRRVQIIYCETVYALRRCHSFALYASVAVYSIPFVGYVDIFALGTRFDASFGCTIVADSAKSQWAWMASLLFPAVLGAYALRMFVRPLRALVGKQKDIQVYRVIIKYVVLFSATIISSLLMALCAWLFPTAHISMAAVHSLLIGWVLILLHPVHNATYKVLCCAPNLCCAVLCRAPGMDEATMAAEVQADQELTVNSPAVLNRDHKTYAPTLVDSPSEQEPSRVDVERATKWTADHTNDDDTNDNINDDAAKLSPKSEVEEAPSAARYSGTQTTMRVIDAAETPSCAGDAPPIKMWSDVGKMDVGVSDVVLPVIPGVDDVSPIPCVSTLATDLSFAPPTHSTTLSIDTTTLSVASFIAEVQSHPDPELSVHVQSQQSIKHGDDAFSRTLNFIAFESHRL